MAVLDDYVTLTLLASSAFFVALSVGLLVRYRQVSQRITTSTDLGHDLWSALEQRMKKQDERIIDMMGRLEVVQARVTTQAATQSLGMPPATYPSPPPPPVEPAVSVVAEPQPAVPEVAESQPISQGSQTSQPVPGPVPLDGTQLAAIRLLVDSPKNTRQLTDDLGKSREHTARIMKGLFEIGLVQRNDSTKPFVYELTQEGRRYAQGTQAQ